MGKSLYIAEKPSVAQEFAKALKLNTRKAGRVFGIRGFHCDLVCRTSGDYELSGGV